MAERFSSGMYRLIGAVGTSRVITRLDPHVYRATGGRWLVGRNFGVLNVIVTMTGRAFGKRREVRRVRAREAEGEVRDRLWALAAHGYPGYELYRQMTDRPIPVVVLEPAHGAAHEGAGEG
jgi:F420H(2)-dependent quinone reductase